MSYATPTPRRARATEEQTLEIEAALRLDEKVAALMEDGDDLRAPGRIYVISTKKGREVSSVRVVGSSASNLSDVEIAVSPRAMTVLKAVIEGHASGWLPNTQQQVGLGPMPESATLRAAHLAAMAALGRELEARLDAGDLA